MNLSPTSLNPHATTSSSVTNGEHTRGQDTHPTVSGNELLPVISPNRLSSTLERSVDIVSKEGVPLGTLKLPTLLRKFHQCLLDAKINPSHFDISGGAVAYLIGQVLAKKYAEKAGIQDPYLDEFNRLQDLDISIDLKGHPNHTLYEIINCMIKAMQASGIVQDKSTLFDTGFLKRMVSCEQGLCIISLGDPKGFWIDFSITTGGPRHLFVRDDWKYNLIPYIKGDKSEAAWTSTNKDPWQPLQNRIEKKLDIDHVEKINHLGFPLAAYYMAKGYKISHFNHLHTLCQRFADFHITHSKKFIDTFQAIRDSHIGENQQIYERMILICLKILFFKKNAKLSDFIQDNQLTGNSPQARLLGFLKNNGGERYRLKAYDIFCLADLMGIEPKLPIPESAWIDFIQNKVALNAQDRQSLFVSKDILPIAIAKYIQNGNALSIPSSEAFDLLDNVDFKEDHPAYVAIKFDCQMRHDLKGSLETYKKHKPLLSNDLIHQFLGKILRLSCADLQPYLPLIFTEDLEETHWIEKLVQADYIQEATELSLMKDSIALYTLILEKLLEKQKLKDFNSFLQKIAAKNPEIHKQLIGNTLWQEKFSKYSLDSTAFFEQLKDLLAHQEYTAAENLLKLHTGEFTIPVEYADQLIFRGYREALKRSEFERLSYLTEIAVTSGVEQKKLKNILADILQYVLSHSLEDSSKKWGLDFFTQAALLSLMDDQRESLLKLAFICKDHLSVSSIEPILTLCINQEQAHTNPEIFALIAHCLQRLQIARSKISPHLKVVLTQLVLKLIQAKDSSNLLLILPNLRALHLKVSVPTETLNFLMDIQDTPQKIHYLAKTLDAICKLPEEIVRPLTERYLKELAISNPNKAGLLYKENSYLWETSQIDLKALYHALPAEAPLKLTVFFSLDAWDKEDWLQLANLEHLNHSQKFQLFIDPRSKNYVDENRLHRFILTPSATLEQAACLLDAFPMPLQDEFLLGYVMKLKRSEFPFYESNHLLNKLLEQAHLTQPFSDSFLNELKALLKSVHKKSSTALMGTLDKLDSLVSKLPAPKQKEFVEFYLELLPKDFENSSFGVKERALLYTLIETYKIQSPFAAYLGLTDSSTEKTLEALNLLSKKNYFQNDKSAQKALLCRFSQIMSASADLWETVGKSFFQQHLVVKMQCLSSLDILQALYQTSIPELQNLFIVNALQNGSEQYQQTALRYLEDLSDQANYLVLFLFLEHPKFPKWVENGRHAVSFRQCVERFILSWIKRGESTDDPESVKSSLTTIPNLVKYCNFKDQSFDTLLSKIAEAIARGLEKKHLDVPFCFQLIEQITISLEAVYEPKGKKITSKKSSLSKSAPQKNGNCKSLKISKLQIEIIKLLLHNIKEKFSNPYDNIPYVLNLITLFQNFIPELHPEAKTLIIPSLQIFFEQFFTTPCYFCDANLCGAFFRILSQALQNNIYSGHFYSLMETANTFSGLQIGELELPPRRYEMLKTVFNSLVKDDTFSFFWNNLKSISNLNVHIIKAFVRFCQNFVYSLSPELDAFELELPNYKQFVLTVLPLEKIAILKPHIYEWSIYLGSLPPKLDEKSFCDSIQQIAKHFPENNKPLCFKYLLQIFEDSIRNEKFPVTQAIVESFVCLLKLYRMDTYYLEYGVDGHIHIMCDLSAFILTFTEYFVPHTPEEEKAANLFISEIVKWSFDSYKHIFHSRIMTLSLGIINTLLKAPIAKGNTIILFGSLTKLADIACAHHGPQLLDLSWILTHLFENLLYPRVNLDAQSRSLLKPLIFNTCNKIILGLTVSEHATLLKLLKEADPSRILDDRQIEILKSKLVIEDNEKK